MTLKTKVSNEPNLLKTPIGSRKRLRSQPPLIIKGIKLKSKVLIHILNPPVDPPEKTRHRSGRSHAAVEDQVAEVMAKRR